MRRSFRFWLVYSIAWLPYAASYMALFITHLGRTFFEAIKGSILNVLPAALLGIGVVAVCQRLHWSPQRRYRFLSAHLVFASLYVALWMNAVPFLNAAGQLIRYGSWSYSREGSFQGGFFTGLLIYVTIAGIVYAVQTTERLRTEEARATRAENLRTRAELEALRSYFPKSWTLLRIISHWNIYDSVTGCELKRESRLKRLAAASRHLHSSP